jgi:hypothetical protein
MSIMAKHLTTVDEVIEKLGGFYSVTELTQQNYTSAVHNWQARRKFPAHTYAVLQKALHEKGLTAPKTLWGMM